MKYFCFALILIAKNAFSVQIMETSSGGRGCPKALIKATPLNLNVGFKKFKVSALKRIQRKSCQLVLSIKIPKGQQVSLGDFTLSGEKKIQSASAFDLRMEAFLAGGQGHKLRKKWTNKSIGPISLKYGQQNKSWSSCGQDVNVRFNLSLMLKSKKSSSDFGQLKMLEGKNWLSLRKC
mgnify:CR=1 FL=1